MDRVEQQVDTRRDASQQVDERSFKRKMEKFGVLGSWRRGRICIRGSYFVNILIISNVLFSLMLIGAECAPTNSSTRSKVLNDQHRPPKKCNQQKPKVNSEKRQFDDDLNELYVVDKMKNAESSHSEPLIASDSIKHQSNGGSREKSKYEPQVHATLSSFGDSSLEEQQLDKEPMQNEIELEHEPQNSLRNKLAPTKSHLATEQSLASSRRRAMIKFLAHSAPTLSQVVVNWNRMRERQRQRPEVLRADMRVRSGVLMVEGDAKDSDPLASYTQAAAAGIWDGPRVTDKEAARRKFLPQRLVLNLPHDDGDDEGEHYQQVSYHPATSHQLLDDRHGDLLLTEGESDSTQSTGDMHKAQKPDSWLYDKIPLTISLADLFSQQERNKQLLINRLSDSPQTKTKTSNSTITLMPLKAPAIRVSANPNTPGGLVINRRGLITAASKTRRPQLAESVGSRRPVFASGGDLELANKAGPPYFAANSPARYNSSTIETRIKAPGFQDLAPSSWPPDYESENEAPQPGNSGKSQPVANSLAPFNKEPLDLQAFAPSQQGKNKTQSIMFNHNPPYKQQHLTGANLAPTEQMGANGARTSNNSNKWKHNPSHLQKHHGQDADRKPPTNEQTTPAPVYKPAPANATVSPQLNAYPGSSNGPNNYSQHLNHPNQHNHHHHHHHNSSTLNSSTTSASPLSRPAKIIDKLQHMIIGTILRNTQPPMNLTSLASSLQPQWQSPSSPAPPPLLSSTVANNLASLIAQRLSIFAGRPAQPAGTNQYFTTPTPPGAGGLGSLFGLRYPSSSVQKFKNRVGPLISAAGLNRRTASVGSILISGLIYGLSVLPALMAVTGINPLSGNAPLEPQAASSSRNQRLVAKGSSSAQHQSRHKRPGKIPDRLPLASQPGFAYLVPLVTPPAPVTNPSDVPMDEEPIRGDSAQQSALTSLYALPPPILGHEFNHLMDDEFVDNNRAPHPAPTPPPKQQQQANEQSRGENEQASQLVEQYHPYARFKGHLHYSRPLAPRSTSDWKPTDPVDGWAVSKSSSMEDIREPIVTGGSMRHNTFAARPTRNLRSKATSRRSSGINLVTGDSTRLNSRPNQDKTKRDYGAIPVGYTLKYSPVPKTIKTTTPAPKLVEFQTVNDIYSTLETDMGNRIKMVKMPALSGGPRYNLNRSFKVDKIK